MSKKQETRKIEDIIITKRFRKPPTDAEIVAFAERIAALGVLLHPIVISPDNLLVAGLRRLLACKHLGWERVPVRVVDLDDIEAGQVAENVDRQPFLPSEIAEIVEAMWDREANPRGRPSKEKVENCHLFEPGHDKGKTRDKVARHCGVSGRQVQKILYIFDKCKEHPEEYGHYLDELDRRPRSVHRIRNRIRASEELKKINDEQPQAPGLENQIVCGDCLETLKNVPATERQIGASREHLNGSMRNGA